jgi:hypothetical protein
MSKEPAVAALLSAPKEAKATGPVYSLRRPLHNLILIPAVRMDALLPITRIIRAGRTTTRLTFLSSEQVDLLGTS